jgi:hypothetical protein
MRENVYGNTTVVVKVLFPFFIVAGIYDAGCLEGTTIEAYAYAQH